MVIPEIYTDKVMWTQHVIYEFYTHLYIFIYIYIFTYIHIGT